MSCNLWDVLGFKTHLLMKREFNFTLYEKCEIMSPLSICPATYSQVGNWICADLIWNINISEQTVSVLFG